MLHPGDREPKQERLTVFFIKAAEIAIQFYDTVDLNDKNVKNIVRLYL
jgi:hypothetical protein